ncbi:hypothetical protein LIER_32486 [Lithospermum erythrorhizon]|uniref:Reverse transcriptase zinc-binding domain-containing protein n=1 Tax=Lithospermum erythrorhizon TaxID=34254 RepID=A0AAV3RVR6_LITER
MRVISELGNLVFSEEVDRWVWKENVDGGFTQKSLWEATRAKAPRVSLAKWLWSTKNVPRHAFVTWLLFQNKLSTRDRLCRWGMHVSTQCVFCSCSESQEHLFFACEFTAQLWRLVLQKLGLYRRTCGWQQERAWCIEYLKGRSLKRRIGQIALMSTVHTIWMERNGRVFGGVASFLDRLYYRILNDVYTELAPGEELRRPSKIRWLA